MSQFLPTLPTRRLPPWLINVTLAIQKVFVFVNVVAGGVILGYLLTSPKASLTTSIIGIFVHFLIIIFSPLTGLLFWFIFYPFTERVINIDLGAGIPDLSPTRFVIMFLFIIILAQVATYKRKWPRLTKVDWAIIAFAIAILLSTLGGKDPIAGIQFVYDNYLAPLVIYFLVKQLVLNRRDLDKVLYTILIIGGYAAVYIIYEQLTSNVIEFGSPPDKIITFNNVYVSYTDSLRLVQGLFKGTHVFGLIFTMSIPFAFYYMFKSPSPIKKVFYVLLIFLMFVGLFYTYKRAAWFSVPPSFLVIQFFYPKFRRLFWVMLVFFGLLLAVTWNQVSDSAVVTERIQGDKLESANGRTDIWTETIELWKRRPLLGYGFRETEQIRGGATENFYLMVLASTGIVGFTPYLLMLIFIIWDSIFLYRKIGSSPHLFVSREIMAVFWGAALTYVLKSFTGNQADLIINAMFMMLVGAVVGSQEAALALAKDKQSEER